SVQSVQGEAFCVLEPKPDPNCIKIQSDRTPNPICASDGSSALTCQDGYVVWRSACANCALAPPGSVACVGALNAPCQIDANCVDGWVCHVTSGPNGVCTRPCTCDPTVKGCLHCREPLEATSVPPWLV